MIRRTIITEEQFYDSLKNDELMESIIVDFEVFLDNEKIDWQYRKIEDVIFEEIFVVRNAEINSGLSFVNCEFKKGIVFNNVKSTNYSSVFNSENNSVSFSECIALNMIFSNNCYFARNVAIKDNCKVVENVRLSYSIIENGGLSIKNSNANYLHISNSNFDVNLFNSTFFKALRIDSLIGNIALVSNEFIGPLRFWNVECAYSFTLNKNLFKDKFSIEGSRIKSISIIGDTFEKKAELENRDLSGNSLQTFLDKIYISESKFIEGFDFNGLGKQIKKIELPLTPGFSGLLKFQGWSVDDIYISGVNLNLKLLFKRVSFRFLLFNDFSNYSDMSFDKCQGYDESILNLMDCDLGASKFNEFDFNSFTVIRIDNATLDKIKPTSIIWFQDEVLEIGNGTQTKQEEFKSKREIYRQIKQALKNNGNQIDSLVFQAKELSAFRNEQKNSGNYDWADRVIMSVSQANDYGLSWKKPAKIVFVVTLLLYIALVPYLSGKISYGIALCPEDFKRAWQAFLSESGVFWQLFNPVRQMKATYGDDVSSGWIYFFDLLHRIFLGIMIFQIVKAFRKFVSS